MFLIGVWKKSFMFCAPALVWGVNLFVASLYPRLIKRVLKFKNSEKFLQTQKKRYDKSMIYASGIKAIAPFIKGISM